MTLLALALLTTPDAEAFCGFYVSGADAALYNDATLVVLMREGTTTALSMQNSVNGPPEDFALVVPVPEVLSEDNVRTLPAEVFQYLIPPAPIREHIMLEPDFLVKHFQPGELAHHIA